MGEILRALKIRTLQIMTALGNRRDCMYVCYDTSTDHQHRRPRSAQATRQLFAINTWQHGYLGTYQSATYTQTTLQ